MEEVWAQLKECPYAPGSVCTYVHLTLLNLEASSFYAFILVPILQSSSDPLLNFPTVDTARAPLLGYCGLPPRLKFDVLEANGLKSKGRAATLFQEVFTVR